MRGLLFGALTLQIYGFQSHFPSDRLFLSRCTKSRLYAEAPDLNSDDPFKVLGIDPTTDSKVIKRAYRKLALKFHPDVSENDRERASAQFAKISWAYQQIGKGGSTKSSTGDSARASTNTWEPPHRRKSSSSSTTSSSTDWRDFMPKTDDDSEYDTGGDSFAQIFADFLAGAAGVAAGAAGAAYSTGGGDWFADEVFSNKDSRQDEDDLNRLLRTASLSEIRAEMDDTAELVAEWSQTIQNLQSEDTSVGSQGYRQRLAAQERADRRQILEGYLKSARRRLVALQTRYKELLTQENGERRRSYSAGTEAGYSSNPKTDPPSPSPTSESNDDKESWKQEGFGSYGRGRRGRRGRSRPSPSTGSSSSETSYSATASPSRSPASPSPTRPSASQPRENTSITPPHRRTSTSSSGSSWKEEDRRRMRELKVDDAFEQLKKELGL